MLELRNISKFYTNKKAVDNVSMEINKGDKLVITGSSGSGKSTLLRMLAGLESLNSGEILLNNEIISDNKYILESNKRNMSFVFQSAALWPHMTVKENIMFAMNNLSKLERKKQIDSLLEIAEISELENRYPDEISGGEARRVSILRAIASNKEIFLLDEPLTNLNVNLKYKLLDFILEIVKNKNQTMIYVTHDLDEAERITGRKFTMENGILKEI